MATIPVPKLKTLTRDEFAQTTPGRAGKTYGDYLGYVGRRRSQIAQKRNRPADPLAALSENQIQKQVQGQVDASINPIIEEITRSIESRGRAAQTALGGLTGQYVKDLEPFAAQTHAVYAGAEGRETTANEALANRLGAAGTTTAAELEAKMRAIGAPTNAIADTAGVIPTTATGAANAGFATGNAALSELRSRGAGAEDFAGKLPGLARLEGLRAARDVQGNLSTELADQIGGVRSRVPELLATLINAARDRELAKAGGRQNQQTIDNTFGINQAKIRQDAQQAQDAQTRALSAEAGRNARAAAAEAGRNARAQAQIDATNNRAALALAARSGRKPNAGLSATYGHIVDQFGRPILKNGKTIPVAKTSAPGGGLVP